jgi:hypothetical protein
MRSRSIKPGLFKNEDLASLPIAARMLFVGLWCLADREGRLEDRPKRIKAELFPYDNLNVEDLLDKLESKGFLVRYTSSQSLPDGKGTEQKCIVIPKFKCHQNPHKNEAPSVLPAPGDIATLREGFVPKTVPLVLTPSSLTPSSLTPDCRGAPKAPVNHEFVDELLDAAATVKSSVATWAPTKADRKSFEAMTEQFPADQLRRELAKFKAYAPQRDYKLFGKTFVSWMGRVTPETVTAPKSAGKDVRMSRALAALREGQDETSALNFVYEDERTEVLAMMSRGIA